MNVTLDNLNSLSVMIVDDLVAKGLVMDCTDTHEEDEQMFQDAILKTLCNHFNIKMEC